MKNIFLIISIYFFYITSLVAQPVVGMFDELAIIYPDTKIQKPAKSFSIETARGTFAGVHILITGLENTKNISFTVLDEKSSIVKNVKWFRMIDVPVTENTGLDRATEKFSGKINPFVIRRAPFRIFEVFKPVTSPISMDSNVLALRLEMPVDQSMEPGKYLYKIKIEMNQKIEVLNLYLYVHDAVIPPLNRSTISYINWSGLGNICKDHDVKLWSEPFWAMLEKYAKLMAKGRQNAFWFLFSDFFKVDNDGNVIEFDRTNLERYIKTFLNEGMHVIQGAPFTRRRDWQTSEMLMSVPIPNGREVQAISDTGRKMIAGMLTKIISMMKDNNWEDMWLQGVFDEPTDEFVERYKKSISFIRSIKPDIKILEATMTTSLAGIVNYWCPQVQEYQANRKFFDARKRAGDKVWVYTCLAPGGPWLNRLVDQERLRQVYFGWACSKYDLDGYLHWGLNKHRGNPFTELVRYHTLNQFLPAGDSHIFYPVKEEPLSCQRFEAHRIGFEDFELLSQLKQKNPSKTLKIINKIIQSFDKYSKDITTYRKAKAELLYALDGLRK